MRAVLLLVTVALAAAVNARPELVPTERDLVKEQMRARPQDPWPRGRGHVILALPGSSETEKAYHEPGGSFSPAVGTFGIAIWVREEGRLVATSDSIPLSQIDQKFAVGKIGIVTETPYYVARWSRDQSAWTLEISSEHPIEVVVRSVGPAGGPVRSLVWRDRLLLINGAWVVTSSDRAAAVALGDETEPGWMSSVPSAGSWGGSSGWGFARITLPVGKHRITVNAMGGPTPFISSLSSRIDGHLPAPRFVSCMQAQLSHLLMGLVGFETRPGETTNYPLQWLRDGAYSLTAIARTGRLDVARLLARPFALEDFFGGFGAEADAPGLALWALEEVASRVGGHEDDEWLWPHFQRKAALIVEMMTAQTAMRMPYSGPIVPHHRNRQDLNLVALPSRDGLINGRMDHHYPLLFVNAVSYRGLLSAAALADRLGHHDKAVLWRSKAAELQQAWRRAFDTPERGNDRTFTSALWPTGIAAPPAAEFRAALVERDPLKTPPLWTYFTLAEAHRWLFLGETDRVWQIVRWFWDHQASPGLYTWWEGAGEENSFGQWERIRGWIDPPHVTPHYWTAAEMLLLQLDMLAYEEGDTLVVGAGIPADWIKYPMNVEGLRFGGTRVGWSWDGKRLTVTQDGPEYKVRLAGPWTRQAQ